MYIYLYIFIYLCTHLHNYMYIHVCISIYLYVHTQNTCNLYTYAIFANSFFRIHIYRDGSIDLHEAKNLVRAVVEGDTCVCVHTCVRVHMHTCVLCLPFFVCVRSILFCRKYFAVDMRFVNVNLSF